MRLFVVEPLATGGMIHYAYQLCTALAAEGVMVTLVTAQGYELAELPHNFQVVPLLNLWQAYDPAPSSLPTSRLARLFRQLHRQWRRLGRGVRLIAQWHKLTNYLLQEKPDLIQFGKINFPFESFFLARLCRHGLILSQICHEFELREQSNRLWATLGSRFYQTVYAQFTFIFLHGEFNRQRFLTLFSIPPSRLYTIPHGNETIFQEQHGGADVQNRLRQQYQLTEGEPVLLFFGNITPSKGLPDLLHAFALVRQKLAVRLIVAGYPTKYMDMDSLKRLVAELGVAESVMWDSRYLPVEEVGPLMELATVVVYPYWNSTQSGALQTAYVFGKPVVATRVGGLPEVVEEGRSGFLVPAHHPQSLAQALLTLLTNPEKTAEMGAYARHLSETRFAWRPIARQILAVYQTL